MEQAGYCWMWNKRKHDLNSHFPSTNSYDDSWEEQAFAEDAAGPLGGCIWPPRSYSCSFCRREFRSAQALGGHMNVHRRDRARLKQSSSSNPQNEIHHHDHQFQNNNDHHLQNNNHPFASLGFHQYPSQQLCNFVYNPSPNSDPVVIASSSSPSRVVSAPPSTQKTRPDKTFVIPSLSSPIAQEQQHKRSPISSPKSCSNSVADKNNSTIVKSACRVKADYVKTDLSVSLNLVVRRTRPTLSTGKEAAVGCKRRRTEASSLPFFLKPCSFDHDKDHLQSEEHKILNPSSIEDLDLELRLGDPPPKVK
ncbi:hypothetical protein CICLE_v10012295mg [Citrus x clementina]|uniref:C2H2-type domain-containing protein n=1 Tax=Citrus clementina TaxID=85681 RepID=V4SNY6_CITCL|nr:zinc finger protein 10 [Citrus x clementina]ESR42387.1 hypothetical protein CICLE_v10012295mg [Citrus x clementina]